MREALTMMAADLDLDIERLGRLSCCLSFGSNVMGVPADPPA